MRVVEKLMEEAKRETGGEILNERLDYQFAWGIQRILTLHAQTKSYSFLFESHDDIVELDHEHAPNKIVFYQVKTRKRGNWTVARFTERPKTKEKGVPGGSIAGKMFDNVKRFSTCLSRVVMVTNMPMPKLSADVGERCLTELDKDSRQELSDAMSAEDAAFAAKTHLPFYHLHYSPLHFANAHHTVVGEVAELLFKRTGSERGAKTFFDALSGECRRRAKPQPTARLIEEFDLAHILRRSDVEFFLSVHGEHTVPSWETALHYLTPLGFAEVTAIKKAWDRYTVERRTRWETVRHIVPRIKSSIEPIFTRRQTFIEALESAVAAAGDIVLEWSPTADKAAIRAIILYEYQNP
ncbi:dsDNA nuclease domain-containing protein [Pararhizobium sp. O133]|uniref:dsDNA nuclease domain-containing protein n=1 Tax=Pararhizobium sp. O133 TaxID=3449278 RepID=UPI003F687F03